MVSSDTKLIIKLTLLTTVLFLAYYIFKWNLIFFWMYLAVIVAFVIYVLYWNTKIGNSGIKEVDVMTGDEFERFLCGLYQDEGFTVDWIGSKKGDYGADLLIKKDGQKFAVQAKRSSEKVNIKAVQEVSSARDYYKCDIGVVVTNNLYTKNAIELAKGCCVELKDRRDLVKYLISKSKK